jgi:hypothetical protein
MKNVEEEKLFLNCSKNSGVITKENEAHTSGQNKFDQKTPRAHKASGYACVKRDHRLHGPFSCFTPQRTHGASVLPSFRPSPSSSPSLHPSTASRLHGSPVQQVLLRISLPVLWFSCSALLLIDHQRASNLVCWLLNLVRFSFSPLCQGREGDPEGGGSHLLVEGRLGLRASWCGTFCRLLCVFAWLNRINSPCP